MDIKWYIRHDIKGHIKEQVCKTYFQHIKRVGYDTPTLNDTLNNDIKWHIKK